MKKPCTSKKGVTVMEMLVVLVIIGMLSLMAMPTFFAFTKNARLKGAARMISSSLRNARSYAITQRAIYTVDISLSDNSFLMIETITAVKRIYASDTGIIDIRNYDGTSPTGIGTITFNPDGTAASTFTENSIRVYDPAEHYIEIRVYPATGSVKTGDIDTDI